MSLNSQPNDFDAEIYSHHCENIKGPFVLPLGEAGPLELNGRSYKIPLVTTEACLVASVNRGAKAIRESGGASALAKRIGVTRAPVYKFPEAVDAAHLQRQLEEDRDKLDAIVATTSRFLKYLRSEVLVSEGYVYVKHFFDSKDAMGMNMATIASRAIADNYFKAEFGARLIAVSSNFCSDKKASLVVQKEGRGIHVEAEARISKEVLETVLKCDLSSTKEVYESKIVHGSDLAKAPRNAHHANMVAAFFLATGQDAVHIVEGSMGQTKMEFFEQELLISVTLPAAMLGTVGGGTGLPHAKAALQSIGLKGSETPGESAMELATVLAGAVLCGELSLMASLAQGSLSRAHSTFRKRTL